MSLPQMSTSDSKLYADLVAKAATGPQRRKKQTEAGSEAGVRLVNAHVMAGLTLAANILVKYGMSLTEAMARAKSDAGL